MDNTKTAEEILIETINKIRRENRHLGTAEEIDPNNIDEYDKLFITTTVGIMEAYASPLKKKIEELETLLDGIKHSNLNTVKNITNALLEPSTYGNHD